MLADKRLAVSGSLGAAKTTLVGSMKHIDDGPWARTIITEAALLARSSSAAGRES